tara:strand:+ start:1635 stop:2111 length:477 start_codon:yes stop_codon:yes gene_type:complete
MTAEVLILHTGGTIGMVPGPNGLAPAAGLQQRIEQQLGSSLALLPGFDLLELDPLIDSADLTPGHWQQLAALLAEHWDRYRGFIILHGTDTMAYSAAALSFMLGASERNVLFTGSKCPWGCRAVTRLPICRPRCSWLRGRACAMSAWCSTTACSTAAA